MLSKSSAPNVVFAMSSTYKVYLPLSRILLSVLISLSSHASLASLASIFATVSRLLLYPSPSSFPILPQFPGSLFPVIICLHHAYRLPSTDRLSNSVILYTLCNASLCVGLVACSWHLAISSSVVNCLPAFQSLRYRHIRSLSFAFDRLLTAACRFNLRFCLCLSFSAYRSFS